MTVGNSNVTLSAYIDDQNHSAENGCVDSNCDPLSYKQCEVCEMFMFCQLGINTQ